MAPLVGLKDRGAGLPDSAEIEATSLNGWCGVEHGEVRNEWLQEHHVIVGAKIHPITCAGVLEASIAEGTQFGQSLGRELWGGIYPAKAPTDKATFPRKTTPLEVDLGI